MQTTREQMMTQILHQDEAATIHYLIDFTRHREHLVDIAMQFDVREFAHKREDKRLGLWLPTWIAGSYLIREFSKNITAVTLCDDEGQVYRLQKTAKNYYELPILASTLGKITVHYEVYCHDLSVRTAYVDDSRLFGNFTSLLLMPSAGEQALARVHLYVPKAFLTKNQGASLACGLPHVIHEHDDGVSYTLALQPAFDYYDYPFEFSVQSQFVFDVQVADKSVPHRFFIAGRHRADLTRLSADVQKICQSYADILGDVPFGDYTFMTMATGSDYGGLEHINSTALITPRGDLPVHENAIPSESYQRFLGLCSHEYFHAWWVKSVRPQVMIDHKLQQEAYTPLLWVFEGFTSYVDNLMLLISGVIDKKSYFTLIAAEMNRHYKTDGRLHQSVAESSFDAWIKLYRPDENTANQGVSYYNKGALVALCLDLTLLKHSKGEYRLFDVIKVFYEHAKSQETGIFGMTEEGLSDVVGQMMGADVWRDFYERYVIGVDELPVIKLLGEFGVNIELEHRQTVWGMSVDEVPSGLKIKHLHRGSLASQAGLSVGDVIVAIDGIRANMKEITSVFMHDDKVAIHAFRRDELRVFYIEKGAATYHQKVTIHDEYQEQGWLDFSRWHQARRPLPA